MVNRTQQPGILIGQIFLERAQFSHRDDALSVPPNTLFEPTMKVDLQGGVAPDEKSAFVRIVVQTNQSERPLYNIDVSMMALFKVEEGKENLPLKDYIRTAAPAALYPFVREAVAGITWRGRFGPLWLKPFNVTAGFASLAEHPAAEAVVSPPSAETKSSSKKRRVKTRR